MPIAQTSENEQGRVGIRERAARLVNTILPNNFAIPLLEFLGFQRPELSRYYVEIDRAIQTYLKKKLKELRYFDIIPKSLGRGNNLHSPRFAYGYLLVYTGKKRNPAFIDGYILGAQQRLVGIIQTNVEFDNYPPEKHIYARVGVDNRLFVAKGRLEK